MIKHRLRHKHFVFWLLSLVLIAASPANSAWKRSSAKNSGVIKTLIVTGQNSHDWKSSSQILKQILEDTGLFEVHTAISPKEGGSMKNFVSEFSDFRLVVLDYNGDLWPKQTQQAFVKYVASGGGILVYHNSGNAFKDWKEYGEIIGLGGGHRDERDGPYVFWLDGEIIQDESAGIGGYHGAVHEFTVFTRNSSHPITSGLPIKWEHAADELYSLMRGPAKNLEILATAYSDMQQRGSGRHEPVLFTNLYGKGRIFHTTLGHVSGEGPFPAVECAGFIVTFQRGAEWAATGQVTQVFPGDFPGFEKDVATPGDVRLWPGYRSPLLEPILDDLKSYEYGQDETVLSRLREYIQTHKNNPSSRERSEQQLLLFLESGATLSGKMAVCRQLRLIGSDKSVPVLEKMLFQNATSDMARYALEKIPGTASERALIQGLKNNEKKNILGIISSLGQRDSTSAVPELSRLLNEPDVSMAASAANALGWIGGKESVEVLSAALREGKEELQSQIATSLLKCAEKFDTLNQLQQAIDLYKKLMKLPSSIPVRQAALKGLLTSDKDGAKSLLLDTLKGEDSALHVVAMGQIRTVFKNSEIQEVLDLLPYLPLRSKITLFPVLSLYPSQEVLSAVLKSAGEKDVDIRCAALEALKILGDATVVPLLSQRAAQTQDREQQTAQISLWNLRGRNVNQAILLELIKNPDPSIKRELIRCVGERRIGEGKQILFDFAASSDPILRLEAVRNLERIVDDSDLPRLLDLILQVEEETEKTAVRKAAAVSAALITNQSRRVYAVIEKLKTVTGEQERSDLLRVLGAIGDNSTLPLLRKALKNKNSPEYESAVRALSEWPDFTPRDDLLRIAQTSEDFSLRVLSLRASIQMIGGDFYRSPEWGIQALQAAVVLAERPEEKIQILALLPRFPCGEALELAESLLSDGSVQAEAELAIKIILYGYFKNWRFVHD